MNKLLHPWLDARKLVAPSVVIWYGMMSLITLKIQSQLKDNSLILVTPVQHIIRLISSEPLMTRQHT